MSSNTLLDIKRGCRNISILVLPAETQDTERPRRIGGVTHNYTKVKLYHDKKVHKKGTEKEVKLI